MNETVIQAMLGPTGGLVAMAAGVGCAVGWSAAYKMLVLEARERIEEGKQRIDKLESKVHTLQEEVKTLLREGR